MQKQENRLISVAIDWKPICPDSRPLPVHGQQGGIAAGKLHLHHAWRSQPEECYRTEQASVCMKIIRK